MQSNAQSNSSHSQRQPTLGQSLQHLYEAVKHFMVQRPQPSAQSPTPSAKDKYGAKAGLYPYLPKGEEQRDWLDRLY
ncbi:MAG: hypothetical protein DCF25_18705 [Leptolyngbya foveolarum]|uniref:Uncharacterized protein n=1 Tax=Leptolyngbya foveolarum TaxID=47253 RepID=A0A2W4TYP5_9CYAN|nr:MAG: hypothetical protein DCF25_18705 [Leptolyngbya foveolarum]